MNVLHRFFLAMTMRSWGLTSTVPAYRGRPTACTLQTVVSPERKVAYRIASGKKGPARGGVSIDIVPYLVAHGSRACGQTETHIENVTNHREVRSPQEIKKEISDGGKEHGSIWHLCEPVRC